MDTLADALLLEDMHIIQRIFRAYGNLSHCLHRLERIFAAGSFAAEHDYVAAVKNRVGNIAGLRTCGAVAVDHAFKHLRSSNNRLACLIAAGNNILLHQGYILGRNFYAQITAGNHHAVRNADNFINMLHACFIFNLRDNPDRRACSLQHFADSKNIVSLLYEGGSNVIHIVLHREQNICPVLLRQEWQLQLYARAGHTLTRAELAAVDHLSINFAALDFGYLER